MIMLMIMLVLFLFAIARGIVLLVSGKIDSRFSDPQLDLFLAIRLPLIGFASPLGNHLQIHQVPGFRDYVAYMDKRRRR